MKIYYHRFCPYIELNFSKGHPTGGSEERLGILWMFHKLGYDVVLNSIVSRKDLEWIKSDDCKGSKFEFLRDFKYQHYKPVPEDAVLFIEHGTTNLRFIGRLDGYEHTRTPCCFAMLDVVAGYKGNVFYWQGDIALPFIMHPQEFRYNPLDPKMTDKSGKMDNGPCKVMSNTETNLKDKHWVIIQRAKPEFYDLLMNRWNGSRHTYKKLHDLGKLDMEYIPNGYPYELLYDDPYKLPPKDYKYTLCYTGNKRSRHRVFKKYYNDMIVASDIFGSWDTVKEKFNSSTMNFHGQRPHGEMQKILSNTLCQIVIGDELCYDVDWFTPRITEAVWSGTIVLIDADYQHPEVIMPEKYLIHSKDEANNKIQWLQSLTYKQRCDIITEQRNIVAQWNIWRWGKSFRKIVDKYSELKKYKNNIDVGKHFNLKPIWER